MKVSGYVLKFGEDLGDGTIIHKDCKINIAHMSKTLSLNQGLSVVGVIDTVEVDSKGISISADVVIPLSETDIELAPAGMIKGREGNIITKFDLWQVSVIPKLK